MFLQLDNEPSDKCEIRIAIFLRIAALAVLKLRRRLL
jgi:hypothetical protein